MKDSEGTILYIGKAKSVRTRLRQYFSPSSSDDRVQIPHLLSKLVDIETILTSSEKEALLLEARLIRRFQPRYNVLLKDDKSELLLRITLEDKFPGIEYLRSKETKDVPPKIFGPFAYPQAARELFDLVVRFCSIRQCTNTEFCRRKTPCLLYQLDRCSAPCVGKVTKEDYGAQVQLAIDFLSGKTVELQKNLKKEIEEVSSNLEFEKASILYRRLQVLQAASREKKRPIKGLTDTDIIGCAFEKNRFAVSVMHYRDGALTYAEAWAFHLTEGIPTEDCLVQILMQYYIQEVNDDNLPGKIVLPNESHFTEPFSQVLADVDQKIKVCLPTTPAMIVLSDLAVQNARARLFQSQDSRPYLTQGSLDLKKRLHLTHEPCIIDCFDASHLAGCGLVASCVGFIDGIKSTDRYRNFHIRSTASGDDLSMLYEAIIRRYDSLPPDEKRPDLILIDGGKEHLKRCLKALECLPGFDQVDVIAIAKEQSRHDKGLTSETLYSPHHIGPIILPKISRELLFLQQIRDEAHRFVIRFQRKTRSSSTFHSVLDSIPGIGPKRRTALLMAFTGIKEITQASVEEIEDRAKISRKQAIAVLEATRARIQEED